MRKKAIIILLLASTGVLFSQEIVDAEKLWSNMAEYCHPQGNVYTTDFIRFNSDTIIDNYVYKKVWISVDEDHQEWNFYGSFIREEAGQVFYREMFGEEGLIYDFNISIGDSVIIDNPRTPGSLSLFFTEIDSVEVADGYRERWKLVSNTYENSEYWIRGIGSQAGVINSGTGIYGGLCGSYTLLCQEHDYELVYQNPEFNSCYILTTNINNNDVIQKRVILSYDRRFKTVKLQMETNQDRAIIISNILGVIIEDQHTESASVSFNLSKHPTGLYVATVIQGSSAYSQKFIVY